MTEGHEDLAALGKSSVFSVRDAVRLGEGLGLDRRDIAVLLSHVLDCNRVWLIAHDDDALTADESARWREAAMRRADGEPVAYIVGCKEFHGLPLRVSPAVLVPRPETELLVGLAIAAIDELSGSKRPIHLLDLGRAAARLRWHASAPAAIPRSMPRTPARRRSQSHAPTRSSSASMSNFDSDLGGSLGLASASTWRFCNAPYVADGDPHLDLLQHEPRAALVGGRSGLTAFEGCRQRRGRLSRARRTIVVRTRVPSGRTRSPGSCLKPDSRTLPLTTTLRDTLAAPVERSNRAPPCAKTAAPVARPPRLRGKCRRGGPRPGQRGTNTSLEIPTPA